MFDYYRVRFKVLLPRRRPISLTTYDGPKAIPMPPTLNRLCWFSWVLAGLAVGGAIYAGPLRTGLIWAWIEGQILLFPVSVALGAGFSERQTWSRPLLIVLLAVGSALLALSGLRVLAAASSIATCCIGAYLYRSKPARDHFAHLREEAMVRIELADLRGQVFVPIYTTIVGAVIGAVLGWWLVSRYIAGNPDPGPMGANDLYAIALTGTVLAAGIGTVGKLFGEALIARWNRSH